MKLCQVLGVASALALVAGAHAAPNIDPAHAHAYGANVGWFHWRPSATVGATLGEQTLSGPIWSANVGWISLGDGAPANGYRYQNNTGSDFGVNVEPDGSLSGMAYGANIGWIVFTNRSAGGVLPNAQQPRVDRQTGRFTGYAYSANCGWLSLGTDFGYVQATGIEAGADTDGDSIADAWEIKMAGGLAALTASGDLDHDGVSDRDEYQADSNPADPADQLRLTKIQVGGAGATVALTWKSSLTRTYAIERRDVLGAGSWVPVAAAQAIAPAGATTTTSLSAAPQGQQYYRVKSLRPGIDTEF